jgi:hypothetical protein
MAASGRMLARAVLIGVWFTLLSSILHADTFSQNVPLSRSLTSYLQVESHFPLARAQVLDNRLGDRKVILFGFVASTDEKITAELRAAEFLGDPWVDIADQLKVRPELRAAGQQQNAVAPPSTGSFTDAINPPPAPQTAASTAQTPNDIQAYEEQFQNEMIGPGFGAFAGAVPYLGAATLSGVPFFFGIPVFGLNALAVNSATLRPASASPSVIAPATSGLLGGAGTRAPTSPGPIGSNRPGFESGPFLGHFRPAGGLGRR